MWLLSYWHHRGDIRPLPWSHPNQCFPLCSFLPFKPTNYVREIKEPTNDSVLISYTLSLYLDMRKGGIYREEGGEWGHRHASKCRPHSSEVRLPSSVSNVTLSRWPTQSCAASGTAQPYVRVTPWLSSLWTRCPLHSQLRSGLGHF